MTPSPSRWKRVRFGDFFLEKRGIFAKRKCCLLVISWGKKKKLWLGGSWLLWRTSNSSSKNQITYLVRLRFQFHQEIRTWKLTIHSRTINFSSSSENQTRFWFSFLEPASLTCQTGYPPNTGIYFLSWYWCGRCFVHPKPALFGHMITHKEECSCLH